ncbi:DinB family protein [Chitinophaga nivalis]|uniref:DinB family protein n=1 Tax=Chitinophaga nivalis TaxID=2991709 RepID=A0ABT3IK82_9BACT|nr:DinB family protein [Chitinophaga nivalis]MCW3465983.1 DinB family protein [Chitinophaga nivalis]MCW3484326.1 DinB family protein [Chitinophaga nivalis]
MQDTTTTSATASTATVLSSASLLEHWQGHRRLTRQLITAFPEADFFDFSIGGMRSFASLALEMLRLAAGLQGIVTGVWPNLQQANKDNPPATQAAILQLWDEQTEMINELWAQLSPARFQETVLAFGAYEGPVYSIILYWIDNEIHHRGQGYVYLRALGITPPAFWNRN